MSSSAVAESRALTRDTIKGKAALTRKTEETANMRTQFNELKARLCDHMLRERTPYLDCGKHGFVELKREGKLPKEREWMVQCFAEYFKGDANKAGQLYDFLGQYKKRRKAEAFHNAPTFSVVIEIDPEKAHRLRAKYTPAQNLFEGQEMQEAE